MDMWIVISTLSEILCSSFNIEFLLIYSS